MSESGRRRRVVIIGAGPTGLGAAWRLHEHNRCSDADVDILVLDSSKAPGGLAASEVDAKGFTWDMGGHVVFSHYAYFTALMDDLLGTQWNERKREAWAWMQGRFVPYPVQQHAAALDQRAQIAAETATLHTRDAPATNFAQWCEGRFGATLCRVFMAPYNWKVWAHPLDQLGAQWVGERVAPVRTTPISPWGPNATFRFPARGGTGSIWRALAANIPERCIRYGASVVSVDVAAKRVRLADKSEVEYDDLVSSAPLTELCRWVGDASLIRAAEALKHAGTHVVGFGVRGKVPEALASKSWIYFPEGDCPFYRATVFSNYSDAHVCNSGGNCWSIMCEVSESAHKPVDHASVVDSCHRGLVATGMLQKGDEVVTRFHRFLPYGYPVPTTDRDIALGSILPRLDAMRVYSRGRFGAWKYEVSNQDHSLMQGVELADRILFGASEPTLNSPTIVNAPGHAGDKTALLRPLTLNLSAPE